MPDRTGQSENLATFLLLRKNPRKPIELAETRLIFARRPNGRSNQFSRYLRRQFRRAKRPLIVPLGSKLGGPLRWAVQSEVGRTNLGAASDRPHGPQNPWSNALHTPSAHPGTQVGSFHESPNSKIDAALHRAWFLPTRLASKFVHVRNLPAWCDAWTGSHRRGILGR